MRLRTLLVSASTAVALIIGSGCAVTRGRETAGAPVDDATVTTAVAARFAEDRSVDASAISVGAHDGTVTLAGFAKSETEKDRAEDIAIRVPGVASIRNQILVRP